jgi:hypothetical protein
VIHAGVVRFHGDPRLQDDMTVVVLKVTQANAWCVGTLSVDPAKVMLGTTISLDGLWESVVETAAPCRPGAAGQSNLGRFTR